jgi:hypothetical protein
MRSYPRNSPQAAARIVALFLIADGHVCCSEVEALTRLDATLELGLSADEFQDIVRTLCEDQFLASGSHHASLPRPDEAALSALFAEVEDPGLQRKVLYLAMAASVADRHLADGEVDLMKVALKHWPYAGAKARSALVVS